MSRSLGFLVILGALGAISVFLFAGCADSQSVAVVSSSADNGPATVAVVDGEVVTRTEVPPDVTPVRVWLCSEGALVFDDEGCNGQNRRVSLQERVHERYPDYFIAKIEQSKEEHSFKLYTVFYVYLRKNS